MKRKKSACQDKPRRGTAFTLVELLIVIGIIALLVALLIPGLAAVRNMTRETQQRAQITTIETALVAFKGDYGGYPPSNLTLDGVPSNSGDYCGAQKLAEALVGWDLMGFHPKSAWRADGRDKDGGNLTYDPQKTRDVDGDGVPDTLKERKESYLELATANAFELGDLFADTGPLEPNTFVLCDVFGKKSIRVGDKTVKVGAPILYYRANTFSKTIDPSGVFAEQIYNVLDNDRIAAIKEQEDAGSVSPPYLNRILDYQFFYEEYIKDPKVTTVDWPYRPDSYILISAGVDGLYGTDDDVRNF